MYDWVDVKDRGLNFGNHPYIFDTHRILGTSIDALVEEFEQGFEPQVSNYSRKLVEFCSSKALSNVFQHIDEMIANVTFTRLTFDMMLSWENPSPENEKTFSVSFFTSLCDMYSTLLLLYLTCSCMTLTD